MVTVQVADSKGDLGSKESGDLLGEGSGTRQVNEEVAPSHKVHDEDDLRG